MRMLGKIRDAAFQPSIAFKLLRDEDDIKGKHGVRDIGGRETGVLVALAFDGAQRGAEVDVEVAEG